MDIPNFDLWNTRNAILEQAEEQDMRPPFVLVAVSRTGSAIVSRVYPDGRGDFSVERSEDGGFRLPMTLTLIDRDNKVIRGEITATGEKIFTA